MKYLEKHKYENLTVCDKNVALKAEMPSGVSVHLGKEYLDKLSEFDVIFRSPGIPFLTPQIQLALKKGAEVTSAISFFLDQCPGKTIGVSGTKGKGTTSTLIYKMLKKSGKDVYLGGNIGEPPINFLDKLKRNSIVVLELSSFQLQDLKISPDYAVLLNTTSDHLDYHVDRGEYLQAKENLLAHQKKDSAAVLNKDYEYVKYYSSLVKGRKFEVSVKAVVKDGAYAKNGIVYYSRKGKKEEIMQANKVGLIGSHNLENILPATVIAKEFKVGTKDIVAVLKSFKGLPHRLEFVKDVGGVRYYNDSFSTTPETSMAAVDSFDEPTILIAGGSDKGLDYENWAIKILTKPSLRTVILIGNTAEKMEKAIVDAEAKLGDAIGSPTKVLKRKSFEDAVLTAYAETSKGWVVVMSPAAASFDMFKNYKERGEKFREIVGRLR